MKINKDPKNIIIRMPNWIGDLVMATPILTDLRKAFPNASITVMCKKPLCDLLQEDKDIDELYCFSDVKKIFARREENKNILRKLRDGKYDLGILCTNSFSSAWRFFQGRVKERIGFSKDMRSFLLTVPVSIGEEKKQQHHVLTYKKLLLPLGIKPSDTMPRLHVKQEEIELAKQLLEQQGFDGKKKLIGINSCCAYGPAKKWPKERFANVAKRLIEDKDCAVVFIGDESCQLTIKEICGTLGKDAINLAGLTSLRELMCVISLCDLFLTNDSGPMHIAAAFGVPVLALFGSTSQVMTGPYKTGDVIDKKVTCAPCFKRTCPIDFKCMKEISADEVYNKLIQILERKK